MFEGSGFTIPALFVAALTVGSGAVCVVAGWCVVLLDQDRALSTKAPSALYTLTLSVLVQLAGPLVLWHTSYDFRQTPIFGTRMVLFVWSFFLLPSFALCLATWWLARKDSGPASSLLRKSSILSLTIWGLGLIWYMAGE
jgi:hypothetical protein